MTVSRLFLQLLVLLGVLLVHSGEASKYRRFAKSHIDYPKTRANNPNVYCNMMMQRRGMTKRMCKPINTFIHASHKSIRAVCQRGGTHYQKNMYDSRNSFPVTVCTNTGRPTKCSYNGRTMNRRVRLSCDRKKPVHFESLL